MAMAFQGAITSEGDVLAVGVCVIVIVRDTVEVPVKVGVPELVEVMLAEAVMEPVAVGERVMEPVTVGERVMEPVTVGVLVSEGVFEVEGVIEGVTVGVTCSLRGPLKPSFSNKSDNHEMGLCHGVGVGVGVAVGVGLAVCDEAVAAHHEERSATAIVAPIIPEPLNKEEKNKKQYNIGGIRNIIKIFR